MKNLTNINSNDYIPFLSDIKSQIRDARIRASRTVNKELIQLYWSIGKAIVTKQKELGWGKSVIEKLSKDLRNEFTNNTGFSIRNLRYMQQFYLEYQYDINLQQLAAEVPWFSNVTIFSKIKDHRARKFYLESTSKLGWSRNVLLNQIKAQAYERQALVPKQHNFKNTLPKHLAEQADKTLKDIYMLDFLGITEPVIEREVENQMVEAIKNVLLELGYGFAFLGNQYAIKANGTEYFVDLLFYHRHLKCLVAFELKSGGFKPEYAGKMNFYLNLLNDFVRTKDENPSLGIILCADRNHLEVEYALNGIQSPIGVAEYTLTKNLPQEFQNKLPDVNTLREKIKKRYD